MCVNVQMEKGQYSYILVQSFLYYKPKSYKNRRIVFIFVE